MSLDDAHEAYEAYDRREALKIVLSPEPEEEHMTVATLPDALSDAARGFSRRAPRSC